MYLTVVDMLFLKPIETVSITAILQNIVNNVWD